MALNGSQFDHMLHHDIHGGRATAEEVHRGVRVANALQARGPAAERRLARRQQLSSGQFEQLSFDI